LKQHLKLLVAPYVAVAVALVLVGDDVNALLVNVLSLSRRRLMYVALLV
jgi:hypothetical protein